ncbi:MAG: hypothetical protein ABI693_21255 [Bryobacteraceae bacterium]
MKTPVLLMVIAAGCFGQGYSGPRPEKADLPYLLHGTNLLATEALTANPEEKKDTTVYGVAGTTSAVRTPLAEPIFLLKIDKMAAERLSLYKMDIKNGRREVSFNKKKAKENATAIPLSVKRLEQGLYRVEANEMMVAGEYCLSPEGANEVFCFQVY